MKIPNIPVKLGDRTKLGGKVDEVRPAGADHQVVSISGPSAGYMKKPCTDCPWRKDAVGIFPAEAFKHSAPTAYDMSNRTFACHQGGIEKGKTCAGFLLRGAEHNLSVRIGLSKGRFTNDVKDGGHELHESYRAMAIANGVPSNDPTIKKCRP